jgi:hypothetical protein
MSQDIQPTTPSNDGYGEIERVLIGGDLDKMTTDQRTVYYMKVCDSLGLNPLTKPFEYIRLNNKLTLYANRNCAEQLRRVYGVSVTDMEQQVGFDVLTVTVKGQDKTGRMDVASGAVYIGGLKGENLANAYLKAETKAKRRLTLSLCGLGMLDETEVETIPQARKIEAEPATKSIPGPSGHSANTTASQPKFGVLIKAIVEKHGLSFPTFTEELFQAVKMYFMDELGSLEAAGWKDKGAALGRCYEGIDQAEKEAMIRTASDLAIKLSSDSEGDQYTGSF